MSAARLAPHCFAGATLAFAAAAYGFLGRARDERPVLPALDLVLVDASASVARAQAWLGWARDALARAARASAQRGHELAVLSYADGVATLFPPGAPREFEALLAGVRGAPLDPRAGLAGGATLLAAALETSEPWWRDGKRPPGTLTLLARPDATGPSPRPELARLCAAGVALELVAPPAPRESDLRLDELVLAPRVEAGAPLLALVRGELRCGSEPPGPAELVLELESASGNARSVRALPLPPGGGRFELPLALGTAEEGRTRVAVRARFAAGGDPWPENERVEARTRADGARVVLVAVPPELEPEARAWLAPVGRSALAGLQMVFVAPAALAAELDTAAVLVSFDLAPGELPGALVADFVRRGGGWLALSGWRFKREWLPGTPASGLATLLPARPRSQHPEPRDVVLLIDGSGSMAEAFDTVRAAALELVRSALPTDRVSLRFFTRGLEPEALLKSRNASRAEDARAAEDAARELVGLRVPDGVTYLFASLRQLAAALSAPESLVFLLSDGRDRDPLTLPGASEAARQALLAARARLVVVGIGDCDEEVLAGLAGAPESVQHATELGDLTTLFQRELSGADLAEGELVVTLAPRVDGSLADEVAAAGQGLLALPPVARFLRNELVPGAEVLWRGPDEEPVLSVARVGLGRTALFAGRPGGDWAPAYVRSGLGEPAEFEGLLRWLSRGERDDAPRACRAGAELEVRGLAADTPAEVPARLEPAGLALVLGPPAELGRDLHGTRRARLDERGRQGEAEVVVLFPGEVRERVVALEQGVPDEFAGRARPVELPAPGAAVPEGERGAGTRAPGWAWATLALGSFLVLVASALALRGQGFGGIVR